MYKDILRSIEGIATFPVLAFLIFIVFFAFVLFFVIRMKKSEVEDIASIPFRDGTASKLPAILLLFSPMLMQAQTVAAAGDPDAVTPQQTIWVLLLSLIVLSFVCLIFAFAIFIIIRKEFAPKKAAEQEAAAPRDSAWKRFMQRMTDAVPLHEESTLDLGHNYDGIRELDNNLPPWWKYGFYLTIVFSVGYVWFFHISDKGYTQEDEYNTELAEAKLAKEAMLEKTANLIDERTVTFVSDAGRLSKGKAIFMTNCKVCHGEKGEGLVGPNLTDTYWIHGGGISNVFKIVKYGVIEKGMVPWEATLRPAEMQEVASFVLSLQGTNPAGAKEPQGDLYVPEGTATDTAKVQTAVLNVM